MKLLGKYLAVTSMALLLTACSDGGYDGKKEEELVSEEEDIMNLIVQEKTVNELSTYYLRTLNGTTVQVEDDYGTEWVVRMIGINSPEENHPNIGTQPFGKEATLFLKEKLDKESTLTIEFDDGPRKDSQGRLLAHVLLGGKPLSELMVKEGYAVVAHTGSVNKKYREELLALQKEAKEQGKGVWSLPMYVMGDEFRGGSKVDGNINYTDNTDYLLERRKLIANEKNNYMEDVDDTKEQEKDGVVDEEQDNKEIEETSETDIIETEDGDVGNEDE